MKNTSIKLALLFFILINMTLISCYEYSFNESADNKYVTELKFNSKEFCENKTKWETNKPLNYQFDYEVDIGIYGSDVHVTSTVKNGVYESSEYSIGGENLKERPADEETLTEDELFEDDFDPTFLRDVYDLLDDNKLKTIDDYITYLEERIEKFKSVDFEEEKYTEYELIIFYDSDYYFPYRYEIHYTTEKEFGPVIGDYSGISGGISNFEILEDQAL